MASINKIVESSGKRKNAKGKVMLFIRNSPNLAMSAAYVKGLANAIALSGSGMASNG